MPLAQHQNVVQTLALYALLALYVLMYYMLVSQGAQVLALFSVFLDVGGGYLRQGELYRLGLLTTVFCMVVFLLLRTPWLLFVVG